jgi:hypothetical protein
MLVPNMHSEWYYMIKQFSPSVPGAPAAVLPRGTGMPATEPNAVAVEVIELPLAG